MPRNPGKSKKSPIGYAVVGLGHIAQVAVLPAFKNVKNSGLVALVSGEPEKMKKLARRYRVSTTYSYETFDDCLKNDEVDAVYIALPNQMHAEFSERAARAGVHVLCEKPMAVTEDECQRMIRACRENGVKLMVAYRLHFEKANLDAIEIAQSGKLGELKFFDSVFSFQVQVGNIRTAPVQIGGGPIYDIGIYCINAARSLFRDEPEEVLAMAAKGKELRFKDIDETVSAVMRFPGERLASFSCSYGASATSTYRVVGSKGDLCLDNAYEYAETMEQWLTIGERTRHRKYSRRDQFGAELVYFSDCILKDLEPEPSGEEGLADVRVIRALHASLDARQPIALQGAARTRHPEPSQEIHRPPIAKPQAIRAEPPHA